MKNSIEMCHPLSLPFECLEIDSSEIHSSAETLSHYFAELLLVREGSLLVSLDQEEIIAHAGDVVMFCPGVRHMVSPLDGQPARLALIRLDPQRLPALPDYSPAMIMIMAEARQAHMPMRVPAEDAKRLELPGLIEQCMTEAKSRRYGYDFAVSIALSVACLGVVRFWIENGLTLPGREAQLDPVYTLTGHIQNHLRESLRVEDLAERCGLSYPWFAKKFREIYGISCKDYIEQIRVARVEQFLLFTDMDLAQISEATGYADCSHMIKNFKRLMDITPGQYRLRHHR